MTGLTAVVVWLIIAAIFFVIESVTYQLVCIWFVVGSIGAVIVSIFDWTFTAQLWTFLIVSIAFILAVRPLLRDKIRVKPKATNADRVIGMAGVVLEAVDSLADTGRVNANGLDWSARTRDDNMRIAKGEKIRVIGIEGIKLIVEPVMDTTDEPRQA